MQVMIYLTNDMIIKQSEFNEDGKNGELYQQKLCT